MAKGKMHSIDLCLGIRSALTALTRLVGEPTPSLSLLTCLILMASGSSSMQAPTTQQVPLVGIGSRLANDPALGGSRQGEVAATPVKVSRVVQSP